MPLGGRTDCGSSIIILIVFVHGGRRPIHLISNIYMDDGHRPIKQGPRFCGRTVVSGTCRGGHMLPRPCADVGSVGQASPLSVCQIARVHHARGLSGHRSLWLRRGTTCAKFWTVRRCPSPVCDRMPWQQACCQSRVSLGHGPRASLVKFMMFNCIVYSVQLFCIPLSACETSSPHTRQ